MIERVILEFGNKLLFYILWLCW